MSITRCRHTQVTCLIVLLISVIAGGDVITSHTFEQWAGDITSQIEADFSRSDNLYSKTPSDSSAGYIWPLGVMFQALNSAAHVDSSYLERSRDLADAAYQNYWCTQDGTSGYNSSYGGCGDRYYDDNAWMALALLDLYELSECPKYLERAEETVVFCMTGENSTTDSPDGGIRWHETDTDGASVCATAPTILANLILYQITGTEDYKTDGLRIYNWMMNDTDRRYDSGLFHEVSQGSLGYLTAVMTQAAIRLYYITGDDDYLLEAQSMASAMESEYINTSTHAIGQYGKWGGHDMTNAYVELYEADGNPYWLNLVVGYLEYLHENGLDDSTGLYPAYWTTTDSNSDALIDNAAVACAYWKMAATPGGQTPDDSSVYIIHRQASRCLRAYSNKTILYDKVSSLTTEQWALINLGNGYFNIQSLRSSDESLLPENNQTDDDTTVVYDTTNFALPFQQWILTNLENGYFNIQNRAAGKSLWPLDGATANSTTVVIAPTDLTDSSQQWSISGMDAPRSLIPSIVVNDGDAWSTNNAVIDAGDTVTLKADGPDSGTWQWQGAHGFTATGSEITLTDIQPCEAGYYTVIHTDSDAIESHTVFHLTVPAAVTLYKHITYNQDDNGWVAALGAGAYTTADLVEAGGVDNDLTSFKIVPGYTVTFYDEDNFQGDSVTKTADSTYIGGTWNDCVSSIIIEGEPSPVAYWQFNDSGDTTAEDSSGNGYDGTLTNMDTGSWTAGKQCTALSFDGTDDYVEIPDYTGVTGTTGRTCTMWIKTSTPNKELLSWGDTSTGGKWLFLLNSDGYLRISVNGGNISGNRNLADGNWHHIAAVLRDKSPADVSEIIFYIDGTFDTISDLSPQTINTMSEQNVQIGLGALQGMYRYFEGLIDEVRIYDRALSNDDIRQIYHEHALQSDFEQDKQIDLADFAVFADFWQSDDADDGDLTCDGVVDIDDLMILVDEWLSQI